MDHGCLILPPTPPDGTETLPSMPQRNVTAVSSQVGVSGGGESAELDISAEREREYDRGLMNVERSHLEF